MDLFLFRVRTSKVSQRRRALGFTLVEAMMSLAVLALTGIGTVSGFMLLNRYATGNRDRTAARMLCQERIEQVLTLPFSPYKNAAKTTQTVPAVSLQNSSTLIYPLGQTTDYDDLGGYKSSAQQTSSESVLLSMQPNGTQAALNPITATRTTKLELANADSRTMRITVTVTWTVRGQTNSYTLYTLRSQD